MLRFFTILTNAIAAAVFTGIAFGQPAFRSQSFLGLMTLSILFVGAVYVLLLRDLVELSGVAATANLILHYEAQTEYLGRTFYMRGVLSHTRQ